MSFSEEIYKKWYATIFKVDNTLYLLTICSDNIYLMGSSVLCIKRCFSSLLSNTFFKPYSSLVTLSVRHLDEECNKMEDKDTDEKWEEWNEGEEEEEW